MTGTDDEWPIHPDNEWPARPDPEAEKALYVPPDEADNPAEAAQDATGLEAHHKGLLRVRRYRDTCVRLRVHHRHVRRR